MTSEEREASQAVIIEHNEAPRCRGLLDAPDRVKTAEDKSRGDSITLHLCLSYGRVEALGWEASGSAILLASCSLMASEVEGQPVPLAWGKAELFIRLLTQQDEPDRAEWEPLGDAHALSGIRHLPARVKCAALPWRALMEALAPVD